VGPAGEAEDGEAQADHDDDGQDADSVETVAAG
jgi:hypothetical protein